MEAIAVLLIPTLLITVAWLGYHFGYRILDAFSLVRSEYGIISEKEYIPPHSEIITKRVTRSSADGGFSPTSYDVPEEIQIAEECILHINLNGKFITSSVASRLYDSVSQGDRVFIKYSQGRFSKKIYLKGIKLSQSL